MKSSASILLAFLAVFLVFTQSTTPLKAEACSSAEDQGIGLTEVRQNQPLEISFANMSTRISLSSFLCYWLVKLHTIDAPSIVYINCKAFLINPHCFNIYYTYIRTLAP